MFFVSHVFAASCPRPADLGQFSAVKTYEECLLKNGSQHIVAYQKRFPSNPDSIDVGERCAIDRAGWYRCIQDPIRFVAKENIILPQPSLPKDDSEPAPSEQIPTLNPPATETLQTPPPPPPPPPPPEHVGKPGY